jgi:hypothetical protein
LVSGEKIVVTEGVEEVVEKIIGFRRRLMCCPEDPRPPDAITSAPDEDNENTEG